MRWTWMLLLREHLEHLEGHARVRAHADADDGDLRQPRLGLDLIGVADVAAVPGEHVARARQIRGREREGQVRAPVLHVGLHDDVDDDARRGQRLEDLRLDARLVPDAQQRDLGFVLRRGDARDHHGFHVFLLGHDPRPLVVVEARTDVDAHPVLHPELDRPDLQHLGAQRGELEHLLVADAVNLARRRDDVGVGRVHAIDVGVDLARVGLERSRNSHRRRVGAAAAQRRDVAVLVDALEAGHDGDLAAVERPRDGARVDVLDAGPREGAVGEDTHLVAEHRHGLAALGLDGQRQQPHGHLLAGGRDHVQLTLVRQVADLSGEAEEAVGLARHRRDDDDDVVAPTLRREAAARDVADAVDGADGRAAVFLNDEQGAWTLQ